MVRKTHSGISLHDVHFIPHGALLFPGEDGTDQLCKLVGGRPSQVGKVNRRRGTKSEGKRQSRTQRLLVRYADPGPILLFRQLRACNAEG